MGELIPVFISGTPRSIEIILLQFDALRLSVFLVIRSIETQGHVLVMSFRCLKEQPFRHSLKHTRRNIPPSFRITLLESVVMSCTQIPVIPEYAYLGILFPVHCHTVYTEWHSHQVLISVIRHQFAFCGKVRQSDLPASAPQAGTVFQQQEPGVERRCGSIAALQAQFTAFAHVHH